MHKDLRVARRKGFEPPTFWFVAKHSIRLSYRRVYQHKQYTTAFQKKQAYFLKNHSGTDTADKFCGYDFYATK